MKRSLWMILMVLMATTLWAIGTGDGKSKINAFDFDWAKGVTIPAANVDWWYCIDLSSVSEYDQPNLVLRLTNNNSTQDMDVKISLFYENSEEKREYTIKPGGEKVWSASVAMLKTMGIHEVYLKINSTQTSNINARLDETEDISDACLNAVIFTGTTTAAAGAERWYSLNLSEINAAQMYVLTFQNTGAAEAVVTRRLSPTCPVSSPATRTLIVPAGQSVKDTLNRAMLTLLGETPYLGVETSRNIKVSGEAITAETGEAFGGCVANIPEAEIWYDITAGGSVYNYYKVALSDLLDRRYRRYQPQISFSNDSNATPATVKVEFVINGQCNGTEYTSHIVTIPAGETGTLDIARDMLTAIDTTLSDVYARISTTQPNMQAMWRMKHLHEGDRCKYATAINWAEKAYQDADAEVWYEIDITEAKAHTRDLVATIINRATSSATVNGWLAFECPYHDIQDMTRTLNAGDTITKIIPYSSFSSIGSDQVWFGVLSSQAVSFVIDTVAAEPLEEEESEACLSATLFDWTYGHVQNADDTIWYKVPMDTLRKCVNNDMLPYVTISNRGAASGTFYVAYTTVCPAQTAYAQREMTISGLSNYEKLISTDMIKKIDNSIDTVYVRVTGTQALSFQVKMVQLEEGVNCTNAIPFNWVTGNDHAANDTLWYRLDLRDAKKSAYDLEIELINQSATDGTARGELATVCPCLTTEKKSFSMKAGGAKKDTIPHATIESFGDTLWIKLAADINLHFEAHLIEPAPFDTIYICSEANKVEYGIDYPVSDTAWFYVLTDTVKHTPLVPQVTLTNGDIAQDIKAEIAYNCPVTATMMTQASSMSAGEKKSKLLERTTAESMAKQHDTIWVRVSGSKVKSFTFRVDLVDPNDGHDCAHAMYLEPDTALLLNAGSDLWYYMDREKLVNNHQYLEVTFKNEDATSDYATLLAYGDCESVKDPILYKDHYLEASSNLADTLTPAHLGSINGQYIYLNIQAERKDSIRLKAIAQAEIDTIWACEKATHIVPNTNYVTNAGDTAWYQLNIRNLRENYIGNATVTVTNLNTEEDLNLQVAKSWECPIAYEMINTQLLIGDKKTEKLTAKDLAQMDSDIVYIRLIPDQNMQFRLDMTLSMGGDCADGILFDWEKGNVHPADTTLWYKVELDTAKIGEHDLRLHIDNLSKDTVTATCAIYVDCMEKLPLAKVSYTFAPDSGKYKDIDRDLIVYSGQDQGTWSIYYYSSNTTRIWVELIPEAADSIIPVTMNDTVCNRSTYLDSFTGIEHTIDADDAMTQTWKDTIEFQSGTYLIDSIITFNITPIVDPQMLTMAQLDSLGALPICKQGMEIYTDSSIAILTRYYEAQAKVSQYPVATINKIYWTATPDYEETYKEIHADYPGALSPEVSTIQNVAYVIELSKCAGLWPLRSEDTTLVAELWRTDSIIYRDTVCVGTKYEYYGTDSTITEDCRLEATALHVSIKDTLGLDRMVDSLYIYYVTTWKMPLVKEISDSKTLPTAAIGESINYNRCANEIQGYFDNTYPYQDTLGIAEISGILWQKSINGSEFELLDKDHNEPLLCGQDTIRLRYAAIMDEEKCGDTIWSQAYEIVATPLPIYVPTFNEDSAYVVCGEPIRVGAVETELNELLSTNDIFGKTEVTGLQWDYQLPTENNWHPYTGKDTMDSRIDEVTLRVTIQTSCGDTAYTFTRPVAPASAENVAEFNDLKASQKYGNRLLMINLNSIIEQLGDTIEESEVVWYQKLDEVDQIAIDEAGIPYLIPVGRADTVVCEGQYYYTLNGGQLSGDYYALIKHINIVEEGKCGVTLRTQVLTYDGDPAPAPTRKVMERGNVVIITEDNDRYDTNGRKL